MTLGEERDYWRREVLDHCGPDEYGALAGFDKELAEADSAQGLGNGVRHRGVSNDWDLAPTELGLHEPASLAERLKAQMRWRGMDLPGACGERNALCVCAIEFSRRKSDRLSRQARDEQKETLDKMGPFFFCLFPGAGMVQCSWTEGSVGCHFFPEDGAEVVALVRLLGVLCALPCCFFMLFPNKVRD
jgi:hypothetical protein